METLGALWTMLLSLDTALTQAVATHGDAVYAIIWLTLFAETGFVVTVFLPGETLLFAAAALAGRGTLSLWPLYGGALAATFAGDLLNFAIGCWLRRGAAGRFGAALISPAKLQTAREQLGRYGLAALVLARFVPVLRSVAPLTAGLTGLGWGRFAVANALGKIVWVTVYVAGGFYLGALPWFAAHFPAVVMAAVAFPFFLAGVRWAVVALARPAKSRKPKG